jgi:hypothetical protein
VFFSPNFSCLDIFLLLKIFIVYFVWGRKEGCTGCWWRDLRGRGQWGDPDLDGRIILKYFFRKL